MKRLTPLASMALSLGLFLGGCAADDAKHYPSLLPRPIESRSDAEPVAPPPPVAIDHHRSISRRTRRQRQPAAEHDNVVRLGSVGGD